MKKKEIEIICRNCKGFFTVEIDSKSFSFSGKVIELSKLFYCDNCECDNLISIRGDLKISVNGVER